MVTIFMTDVPCWSNLENCKQNHVKKVYEQVAYVWGEVLKKSSTLAWILLPSEARNQRHLDKKINRTREIDDVNISFILKPFDLKLGMHVVKILFYVMKPTDYTYYTYFLIF